jgi:hypothetical protein
MLLMAIEAMFPDKRMLHVFLDNARYHHAKLVQAWLPDQAPLRPCILSPSEPNRTIVGIDAQAGHPQQMLRHIQGVQRRDADLPAREGAPILERILRPGQRQFPCN